MTDDRPLVGVVEIDDEILGGDDFKKGDPPLGIGVVVKDDCPSADLFLGGVKRTLSEGENVVDGAVGALLVSFDGIDAVFFGEVGNIGDHSPVAHVAGEIDFFDSLKGRFWVLEHLFGGAGSGGVGIDWKEVGK
jgi:hypothetical protein